MRAIAILAGIPLVMWLGQTVLLRAAGLPLRWRISAADLPRPFKRINRAVTYAALLAALGLYPLLRGYSPLEFYAQFFPLDRRPRELLHGGAAAILYLALLYLAWVVTDNVRCEVRHGAARLARRLAGVPPTALLVALVEELLFRAVLLAELLESLPAWAGIPIGVGVFAGAHYIRSVKRYWTFPGHLALGTLLCLSFYWTRALWLPVGLHAGGVVVLMGVRPFVRYCGPAWLVGASIFPYAGVVGVGGLLAITLNMWLCYGGGG